MTKEGKWELGKITVEKAKKRKNEASMEEVKNRLRHGHNGHLSITHEVDDATGTTTYHITSDTYVEIKAEEWKGIEDYFKKNGIHADIKKRPAGDIINNLSSQLEERKRQAAEWERAETAYNNSITELQSKVSEAEKVDENHRLKIESLETSLNTVRKELDKAAAGPYLSPDSIMIPKGPLSGKTVAGQMLEGYRSVEVSRISGLAVELENTIDDLMLQYGIDEVEELYRRFGEGAKEFDASEHEILREAYNDANKILENIRANPELMKVADNEKLSAIKSTIKIFKEAEVEKKLYEENRDIRARLAKRDRVMYYVERGDTGNEMFIDVYVPLEHREGRMKYAEAEVLSIIHDAWVNVKGLAKGKGNFAKENADGITKYRFSVPASGASKEGMQSLYEGFIGAVVERKERSPLRMIGMDFSVMELRDVTASPEPAVPHGSAYHSFASKFAENGISYAGGPEGLFKKGEKHAPEKAALRAAIMLSIGDREARRRDIVEGVENLNDTHGIYDRSNLNSVDLEIKGLMGAGIIRKAGYGKYALNDAYLR